MRIAGLVRSSPIRRGIPGIKYTTRETTTQWVGGEVPTGDPAIQAEFGDGLDLRTCYVCKPDANDSVCVDGAVGNGLCSA